MQKTVLITGASRGIGRAAAVLFAGSGYRVAINYFRSGAAAKALAKELIDQGFQAQAFRADVSDAVQVGKMVRDISHRFGDIDILINNAGIAQQKLFSDITTSDWSKMFSVNVDGAFYTCKAVLPQMIARHAGKIINVSSIWGMVGASCEVHYSASKATLIGFTKALAKEVAPSGIQVNCVAPGVIDTEMNESLPPETHAQLQSETPLGRMGTPKEIAALLLFLASGQADFITGQVISPNGGFVIT